MPLIIFQTVSRLWWNISGKSGNVNSRKYRFPSAYKVLWEMEYGSIRHVLRISYHTLMLYLLFVLLVCCTFSVIQTFSLHRLKIPLLVKVCSFIRKIVGRKFRSLQFCLNPRVYLRHGNLTRFSRKDDAILPFVERLI